MRVVICGTTRPRKWKPLAAAIMWWEGTDASHVYFLIKRDSGVDLVYQAVGAGTEFIGSDAFFK